MHKAVAAGLYFKIFFKYIFAGIEIDKLSDP